MQALAKIMALLPLVILLSACAASNRYGGYAGDDGYYSSGYNYPSSGGYYPQPTYPYGNYRNYSYNRSYPRYPAYPPYPPPNPGYNGYNQPYYGGYPNNNYYYNRNQPRPIPAPPGFYRNQKPPVVEQHHHHEQNNYYYGRPPYRQGGKPGMSRVQPYPPPAGRSDNWQGQQPNRNYGNQGNQWGGHGNWQRQQQGNQFNHHVGDGQWQRHQQQQPVVRIQNNGGNVNFGRMSDRMGQQPMQQGHNRAFWERRKHRQGNND